MVWEGSGGEAAARAQAGPPPGNAGAVLLATVSPRCILSMSYLEGKLSYLEGKLSYLDGAAALYPVHVTFRGCTVIFRG